MTGPSSPRTRRLLSVPRFVQPDDVTCGPTCLLQVFRYFGDLTSFQEIVEVVKRNEDGGTLAVHLGAAALMHGYEARIYSWNLRIFDPTWRGLETGALRAKLRARERGRARRSCATPSRPTTSSCARAARWSSART